MRLEYRLDAILVTSNLSGCRCPHHRATNETAGGAELRWPWSAWPEFGMIEPAAATNSSAVILTEHRGMRERAWAGFPTSARSADGEDLFRRAKLFQGWKVLG